MSIHSRQPEGFEIPRKPRSGFRLRAPASLTPARRLNLLLRFTLAIRMHHIVAPQPGLQREHGQNCECGEAQSPIAQGRPRQRPQNHEGGQRHVETIHFKSLVHREGFEPSYLRGGADLQSAGFNHSPTCAELQNSSPYLLIRHSSQTSTLRKIVQTDSSIRNHRKVKNRKARANMPRTQTPHLENSLWSAVGKLCQAAAAPNILPSGTNAGAGEGI
jgi:hypothetical protein